MTFSPLLLPSCLQGIPDDSPIYFPPSHTSALLPLADMVLSLFTPFSTTESWTHDSFMLTLHCLCYLVLYLDSRPLWQAFPRPFLYLTIALYAYRALGLIFCTNIKLLHLKSLVTDTQPISPLVNHWSSGWLPNFTKLYSVMPDAVTSFFRDTTGRVDQYVTYPHMIVLTYKDLTSTTPRA